MIKFNDNNIYVGYIKQLLEGFHLPTIRCCPEDVFLTDKVLYIKDNYIQSYQESTKSFKPVMPYTFNRPMVNYTKNLRINDILYDSHTHEYLGEYLRFIRDFKHVNLMSMYNCFSNNLISALYMKTKVNNTNVEFMTDDTHKVYALPVKFFQKYTIALSSSEPIEIICGFYTKSLLEGAKFNIWDKTYLQSNDCSFKKPFIYDKLYSTQFKNKDLLEHEKDLKMFIKIPLHNDTSIVVLEGEYLNTNSKLCNSETNKWENASMVINYKKPLVNKNEIEVGGVLYPQRYISYDEETQENHITYDYYVKDMDNDELNNIQYLSSLQLLELNSKVSFPLSDRLIEYLVFNPITKDESIPDNIERLQKELLRRKQEGYTDSYPVYDGTEVVGYVPGFTKAGISNIKYEGVWEDKYKAVLYDIAKETGIVDNEFDVIGYLDKNVEIKLGSDIDIYEKE